VEEADDENSDADDHQRNQASPEGSAVDEGGHPPSGQRLNLYTSNEFQYARGSAADIFNNTKESSPFCNLDSNDKYQHESYQMGATSPNELTQNRVFNAGEHSLVKPRRVKDQSMSSHSQHSSSGVGYKRNKDVTTSSH